MNLVKSNLKNKNLHLIMIIAFIIILSGCSVQASSIQLDVGETEFYVGETLIIDATVLPENSSDKNLEWESEDVDIASVRNGIVSGVSPGNTVITAYLDNGVTKSIQVSVLELITIQSLTLNQDRVELNIDEEFIIEHSYLPSNANNTSVSYSSSNENVATVDRFGKVRGISPGVAVVIVETENDIAEELNIIVLEDIIEVESISTDLNQIGLEIGENYALSTSVLPVDATNQDLTFISSNSTVARVNSSGEITAINEGTAVITIRSDNLKTTFVQVYVRYGVGDQLKREVEPNGSVSSADNLEYNGTTFTGSNSSSIDMDLFSVYLPSGVSVLIVFQPEFSLDVIYYVTGLATSSGGNLSDNIVAESQVSDSGDSLILRYDVEQAGEYIFIIVYDFDSPYSDGDDYTGYIWWE